MSLAVDATRGARSNAVAPFKNLVAALGAEGSALDVLDPLRGSNASRQYNGTLRYRSLLERREETIGIEISLREPVLDPPARLSARTAVLHWRDRTPLVEDLSLRCLSYREAMAEKLRAALSRREPAVREFFDLDHAVESGRLDAEDGELLELVRTKLAVSAEVGEPIDLGVQRWDSLRRQIESVLRPVLRERDLERFDLDRAFEVVQRVARAVER